MENSPEHCCTALRDQVDFRCDVHPERGGCGDYLIAFTEVFDEYGLWVHTDEDGSASSWLSIHYCPFCGSKLPPSRREQWHDLLEERGLDPDDLPAQFDRYGWWLQL